MSTIPYQQIIRHLQSPQPIIFDPSERECDPPEDPNWPSPTDDVEVQKLINRLPHWAAVVCAITAAEMVLPIWEEWARGTENLSTEDREAPSRAIEATLQWLDEETPETRDAARDAACAAHEAVSAAWAAAARTAARGAAAARAAARAADAARAAARAAAEAAAWGAAEVATWAANAVWVILQTQRADFWGAEFYNEWWRLCRCRLAFILEARTL